MSLKDLVKDLIDELPEKDLLGIVWHIESCAGKRDDKGNKIAVEGVLCCKYEKLSCKDCGRVIEDWEIDVDEDEEVDYHASCCNYRYQLTPRYMDLEVYEIN